MYNTFILGKLYYTYNNKNTEKMSSSLVNY